MKAPTLSAFLLLALSSGAEAFPVDRGPIIWNSQENEVAVIKGTTMDAGREYVVIQPTKKFLGLGRYIVVMPSDALFPRARGGWYTGISNDDIPYLPPVYPTYFQPSGT